MTHIKYSQMNDAHQLKVVYNFHYRKQFCIKSQHFHDYVVQTWIQIVILGHLVEGEVGHRGCDRTNHCDVPAEGLSYDSIQVGSLQPKGRYNQGKNQGKADGFCWFGMDMSREE